MDILGHLKEKISESVINKISGFLGETPEEIASSVNIAVPTVLGGIIQHGSTEKGAGQVMDILKEGGHTGDILEDLPNLLSNFDKTQVLITIGTNIFSYFLGNKANNAVDKLASIVSIRRTSASSVLSLASPLVLGAIGKVVQKEGLGISGLMKLLGEQQDSVAKALPPAILSQLNLKQKGLEPLVETKSESNFKEPTPAKAQETKTIEEKAVKTTSFKQWIPWVFLALLVLASTIYVKKCKNTNKSGTSTNNDSLLLLPPKDNKPIETSDLKIDSSSSFANVDSSQNASADAQKSIELKPEAIPTIEEPKAIPAKKIKETAPKAIEQAVIEKPKAKPQKIEPVERPVEKERAIVKETKSEVSTNTTFSTGSWINLAGTGFKRNSAEILNNSEVKKLAAYLKKNPARQVTIRGFADGSNQTLSEDRAYSIREKLIEYGISESRIDAESSKSGSSKASIRIK